MGVTIDKIGSLFMYGAEEVIVGNDLQLLLYFKAPFDPKALAKSYEKLVQAHPQLQSKWLEAENGKSFKWGTFSDQELKSLLEIEKTQLQEIHDKDKITSDFHPTNERLPYRITVIEPTVLSVLINHVFSNGLGGIAWTEKLMYLYAQEIGSPVSMPQHPEPIEISWFTRFYRGIIGLWWSIAYMIQFFIKTGKKPAENTIDLTHGKKPNPGEPGYAFKSYLFSEEETGHLISKSKKKNMRVTEYLIAVIGNTFFDSEKCQGDRICVSMPTDVHYSCPGITYSSVGNFTGGLIFQLFRDLDIHKQIKDAFKWIDRQVPYYFVSLFGKMVGNEQKVAQNFAQYTELSIPERAPLQNFTFAISNIGNVKSPSFRPFIDHMSIQGKTQTILICLISINKKLSMEVCVSKQLYQPEEVFSVIDDVYQNLTDTD